VCVYKADRCRDAAGGAFCRQLVDELTHKIAVGRIEPASSSAAS
jgi:hypothetical protein